MEGGLVLKSLMLMVSAGMACAAAVPVPMVTAVPVTADSYPFLANSKSLAPLDLAKAGYVEEEFIVAGAANVYDWASDGSLSVKTPNAPYATRILVRRPANAARFSGSVVVEIPNTARRFDWAMMWGFLHDQIMEHGDAWALVTMPGSVEAVKKFNPTRYAALSFANPAPGAACAGAGKNGPSAQEDGLKWDVLSQVAAALKSGNASGPLGGFKAQSVYMTVQGSEIVTYINALHSRARLENGKPAYDGYLTKNAAPAGRISQCAAAPVKGDPRQTIANVNVPVVNVVAEGEVLASLAMRKPDSDDPGGRFRQYEIAGAAHIDRNAYVSLPVFADQIAAVGSAQGTPEFPFNAPCDPPIPLSAHPLLKYAFHGALANLDLWVRKGVAPPKADRIGVKDAGTGPVSLVSDEFGAGVGGVRSPYVDAPTATYYSSSPGPGTCRELGHIAAFDAARIQTLYSDQKKYAAKVNQSVDRGVKERFFTESDGKKMKAELLASPTVWTPPRTPDGHPDLQGIWTNATLTPLERPKEFAGKEFFSDKEAAEFAKQELNNVDGDRRDGGGAADVGRAYNEFWRERGGLTPDRRTSLIIDPPDGRVPPLTPAAQKQAADRAAKNRGHQFDGPENRSLAERCIAVTNAGPPMIPANYNANYQIVQAPGYVALLSEQIHDVRIIPTDGRPHLPQNVRQLMGDSRGHWEGNTLVVDTTNFTDRTNYRGSGENLHLTERFTRTDAGTMLYEFTVDDPAFSRPWTARIPMPKVPGPVFEYACHEGNYGLAGSLSGARAEERKGSK